MKTHTEHLHWCIHAHWKKNNWIACLMKIKTTNVAYTILALYIYIIKQYYVHALSQKDTII